MKRNGILIAFAAALFGIVGGALAGYTLAQRASTKPKVASVSTEALRHDASDSSMKAEKKISVIAVLVAYEAPLVLSTGEQIDCFTSDSTHAFGDSFLFSVLVPSNLAGRLFFVLDHSGPMNRDPSKIFKIGTRYRFNLEPSILTSPWDIQYSLTGPGVKEAPITKEEVDSYIGELGKSIKRNKIKIDFLAKRISDGANAELAGHYAKSKSETEKHLAFLESAREKALNLLKNAEDNYPDVMERKWKALQDEGWGSIPRAPDSK